MPASPVLKFLTATTLMAATALVPVAQAEPVSVACTGTLTCYIGVDPGSTDSAADPSLLPRTVATAARNAFLGRLTGVRMQDFESATLGPDVADGLFSGADLPGGPISGGPLGLSAASSSTFGDAAVVNSSFGGNEYFGRFNTSPLNPGLNPGQWIDVDGSFALDFATPVSGFGFFATDIGDFEGSVELLLRFVGGDPLTIENLAPTPSASTNGALLFFGVVDDTRLISSVEVRVLQKLPPTDPNFSAEIVGFDDLLAGALKPRDPNPMPEPGTLALAGLSLLGLAAARRRRQA